MGFRFEKYDAGELKRCGLEFENAFRPTPLWGNKDWTPAVLEWFRNTAAPGISVYPPADRPTKGEFIVDLCHATYPLNRDESDNWPSVTYYERAFAGKCEMNLALESEWGRWGNADLRRFHGDTDPWL